VLCLGAFQAEKRRLPCGCRRFFRAMRVAMLARSLAAHSRRPASGAYPHRRLAQVRALSRGCFPARIAPARLNERDHIGDLLIVQNVCVRCHGERGRRRSGSGHGGPGQYDMDCRSGIAGLQHRVAGERGKCFAITFTV